MKSTILAFILLALPACTASTESDESETDLTVKTEVNPLHLVYYTGSTTQLETHYRVMACDNNTSSATLERESEGNASVRVFHSSKGGRGCERSYIGKHKVLLSDLLDKKVRGNERSIDFKVSLPLIAVETAGATPAAESAEPAGFEVQSLESVTFGLTGQFYYQFTTGGGCGTHTSGVSIDLKLPRNPDEKPIAKLVVKHATDDICEGLTVVKGEAQLKPALAAAFKRVGRPVPDEVLVELPPVDARILN